MTDETPAFLDDAARAALEHHLADLPVLHDLLLKHEDDLLAHGERSHDDPAIRYPADLDVIDLADTRPKVGDYEPRDDQAERARFARLVCGGQRRHGVLQELAGWVRLADGEMHDEGHDHVAPVEPIKAWAVTPAGVVTPTRLGGPTVATEAGWLAEHVDWLVRQPWADELATDMAALVRDLRALVGDRPLSDELVIGTMRHCAQLTGIPFETIRTWSKRGIIAPVSTDHRGVAVYLIADVAAARR